MRLKRFDLGLCGVAVAVAAATLIFTACGQSGANRALRAPETSEHWARAPRRLEYRWLVRPAANQEPPFAAPIAIAGRGRSLYVLELIPAEVRVYDRSNGAFRGRLGGPGDGPGEYRYPTSLAVNESGVVAVFSMSGRLTLWVDGVARALQVGRGMGSSVAASAGDAFIVKTDVFPPDDVAEFRRSGPEFVDVDPFYTDDGLAGIEMPGGGVRNHAYAVTATLDGELLLSPPGPAYRILRIGRDGEVRQAIERPELEPLRLSAADREAVRREVRRGFAGAGRRAPDNFKVPEYRAHISRLVTAVDGTIWALTQRGSASVAILDVFAADGHYQGSLEVGLAVSDLVVFGDAIYFLAKSELDLAGIAVVYRSHANGMLAE